MSEPATPRRRLSAEERREQITAAAVVVLDARGFRGTSATAIAQQAGISKGLLWHYFTGLDDLLAQTAERTLITLRRAVGDRVDLTAPAAEVVCSTVHAAASLRSTHGAERRAMAEIVANLRTEDGAARLTLRDYDATYASQEEIVRRGQAEGDVDPDLDPRAVAVTYQGAIDAMLDYLDTYPDADPQVHAETVAAVLLQGLRPRP